MDLKCKWKTLANAQTKVKKNCANGDVRLTIIYFFVKITGNWGKNTINHRKDYQVTLNLQKLLNYLQQIFQNLPQIFYP